MTPKKKKKSIHPKNNHCLLKNIISIQKLPNQFYAPFTNYVQTPGSSLYSIQKH